jgi:methionine-rich copper-binding protein CopC
MSPISKQQNNTLERNHIMLQLRNFLALVLAIILLAACSSSPSLPPIPDPEPQPNPTDTTAPTILMTKPSSNASDVAVNSSLSITFSEAMDSSAFSLSLSPDATMQTPSWNADKTRVSFVPQSALNTATTYTVTLNGKDLDGNDLSGGNSFSFTTGSDADNTSPILVQSTPANNSNGFGTNATIALLFNEPMASATLTLDPAVSFETPVWNDSRTFVVFTPGSALAANTTFTATVTGEDLAANALMGSSSFSFSTAAVADTTAPSVVSTNPTNNATNVASNSTIILTFSEAMNQASVEAAFGSSPLISCSWAWNAASTVATCTPASLAANTQYNISLGASAEDNAGNNLAYSFTFRTANTPDTTKPMVVSSSPANNANNVALNANIVITFSEAVDKTATLAAIDVDGNLANYKVADFGASWNSAGTILTLNPDVDFQHNEIITVEIGTTAKDVAGNGLANSYISIFTTLPAADTTPPTIVSVTPDFDEIGVKRDAVITITFSEPMDTTSVFQNNSISSGIYEGNNTTTFSWNAEKTVLSLPHTALFKYGANIVFSLTTGVKDAAGNALAQPFAFEFRVIRRTTTTLTPVAALSGQAAQGGYFVTDTGYAGENTNESIRTALTFDLSGLPLDLTAITSASLYLSQTSVTGNPYGELGNLEAHHVNYGASLDGNDFNTSTLTICNQNLCIPDPHSVVMNQNVLGGRSATDTAKVQNDWNKRSERGNRSQYLIKFAQDRFEDGNLDQVRFNLSQSYLSVTYEHP